MSSPPKPSRAFAQWRKIGEEKNQKAFTVAGPCGNFTRFPILLLPEKRQQAPEAKTIMLRRRLIYTERCLMEMLRLGAYKKLLDYCEFWQLTANDASGFGERKHSGDEENKRRSVPD